MAADEVVLDRGASPAEDPLLLLRAATEAAERDLVLAPTTAARLVRECPPLPDPWPPEARDLLVRLLAAGPGLLGVWETLDETGALEQILPEWERVRLLPHASAMHRFTVDRHLVETCIEASALIRQVARPDVLMVAALLHDIGKGSLTEHSVAGAPIARSIATRMGFDEPGGELIALLVRWHLLLAETATTRDPDDPATVEALVTAARPAEELELLAALTEADARATSDKAWTRWRAALIRTLVRRAAAALAEWRRVAAGGRRRDQDPRTEVRRGRRLGRRRARRRRLAGHCGRSRTGSGCSPTPRRCFALQRIGGAGGPGLDAGPASASRSGTSPRPGWTTPAAPAARGDQEGRIDPAPGWRRTPVRSWSPRSPYARRPRRGPR